MESEFKKRKKGGSRVNNEEEPESVDHFAQYFRGDFVCWHLVSYQNIVKNQHNKLFLFNPDQTLYSLLSFHPYNYQSNRDILTSNFCAK